MVSGVYIETEENRAFCTIFRNAVSRSTSGARRWLYESNVNRSYNLSALSTSELMGSHNELLKDFVNEV